MARILAIDYGTKRVGLAVTDPLKIIANGLDTVPTSELFEFLEKYPDVGGRKPCYLMLSVASFVGELRGSVSSN